LAFAQKEGWLKGQKHPTKELFTQKRKAKGFKPGFLQGLEKGKTNHRFKSPTKGGGRIRRAHAAGVGNNPKMDAAKKGEGGLLSFGS